MTDLPPELITIHVWTVPKSRIGWAIARMATDRRRVRRAPGVRFAKLMGTGNGNTFKARDANLTRWALLTCWASADAAVQWESSRMAARWRTVSDELWRVELAPLSSRGTWSGREPFGRGGLSATRAAGPVAALTRARLRPQKAARFWRAVPPVSTELQEQSGLRFALGIGEAPIGLQGTFSVWESAAALRRFAYASPHHMEAIAQTTSVGWYAEELFARFAVLASSGSVDGRNPAE